MEPQLSRRDVYIAYLKLNETMRGGSTVNRGHEHQRSIRRCSVREGRPRRFGGAQRGSGT